MVSEGVEAVCGAGWCCWRARLALLLAVPVMLTGLYCTNYVFLAADVPYRCLIPECESLSELRPDGVGGPLPPATWAPEWGQWAAPAGQRCARYQPEDQACLETSFNRSQQIPCEHYVYKSSSSIVSEFNLACQEWKRTLVGTIHNVGMLISLPIMGYVSDRWGRRSALLVSGVGAGALGLAKSFVPDYPSYLAAELLETILGASVYPAAFVLMIEWLGVEQRILASLILGIPLSAGAAAIALLDYLAGYWRYWARIAYPPSFLLLLYPWLLPESVRWLTTRGRHVEATQIIKQAAQFNRSSLSADALDSIMMKQQERQPEKKIDVPVDDEEDISLWRALGEYSQLRRRLCVCGVWWMSAVFVFYGLAARAHALSGSPHVNYALLAAAELPALVLNTLLLDRVGRRPLLTAAFLLTALTLITIPFLPDSWAAGGTALYLCGKCGAAMSLNALYVYTAELFPTRARHSLLAACSTLGRVGSILAPLTPLLAAYKWWLPTLLFGALPLISAALTRLVPDTLRKRLPDTYSDLQP